jgi:hypothetical protein
VCPALLVPLHSQTLMDLASDLKLLHYYLKIEVKQVGEGFVLSQASYARKFWRW